jgi:hypothetical protein
MPPSTWAAPAVEHAMRAGARASRHFWFKAGTWIQRERADYLAAMVMNRTGRHDEARAHALAATTAIEENGGGQDVDLAFHCLELAHAEERLGRLPQAAQARARAEALAASFADDSLAQWFAAAKAKLDALNPQGGA